MNILIINGSPKGKNSITLQTALYLEKSYPNHKYEVINVGQLIKKYEKDFSSQINALNKADMIIFAYPVYTFIAPYQLHRYIELLKDCDIDLSNKYVSQITTSKHFYDMTAHTYIKENCLDLNMLYLPGLSADMEDLLSEKGRLQADNYFKNLFYCIDNNIIEPKITTPKISKLKDIYQTKTTKKIKDSKVNVVIVTNYAKSDLNLINMIEDFSNKLKYQIKIVNVRDFKFSGGCLGCFGCTINGKCIYKDGFDDFLRNEIQSSDAIVYAFSIENHYTHSSFKCYDDRQFCNGHRAVTAGMPVGYLISGDYQNEPNLQTIVSARCEVGGNYLSYIATDEYDTENEITKLAKSLEFAFENKLTRPANFYGVGGNKIFRDLIYLSKGLMQADHKFYKQHNLYDYPHKEKAGILKMWLVGTLLKIPSAQKKMKGKMSEYIVMPYQKIIENTNNN